jgi:hypothetical protein
MLHVKQIHDIIESGQTDEAHQALEQLLALGPNNTNALKLLASLYEHEGRFAEEAKVWDRVAVVDKEDPDAVAYLLRRQLEDREHFYFTDDVPGGGRRFMAYPRSLVNNSAIGLVGCVAFLLSTRLAASFPALSDQTVMLGLFGFFVMLPWVSIIFVYCRCIRSVTINTTGVAVSTRLRSRSFAWNDLEKVCLARSATIRGPRLTLIFLPKDQKRIPLEIDLNLGSTAIRARTYLIREIARLFSEPECIRRESLDLDHRKVASF